MVSCRAVQLALPLLLSLLAARGVASAEPVPLSDEASFMVVVVHGSGFRCAASLVTLRAAVSSLACARGGRGAGAGAGRGELWAVAAGGPCAECMTRVRSMAWSGGVRALADEETAWRELALLELEAAFGAAASPRAIVAATDDDDCRHGCNVVRTVRAAAEGRPALLRVHEARMALPAVCAALLPWWAAAHDHAFCLQGPELCESEWGSGVVCGGRLCGVVARSVGAEGAAGAGGAGAEERGCGAVHAALFMPRWRKFMNCAHTRRSCGRDDCENVCSERSLLDDVVATGAPSPPSPTAPSAPGAPDLARTSDPGPPPRTTTALAVTALTPQDDEKLNMRRVEDEAVQLDSDPAENNVLIQSPALPDPHAAASSAAAAAVAAGAAPTRTPPPAGAADVTALGIADATTARAAKFEPNRADFRGGEYEDVTDYGGADGSPAASQPTSTPAQPPPPPLPPTPPHLPAAPQRRAPPLPPPPPPRAAHAAKSIPNIIHVALANIYIILNFNAII